MITQPRWMQKRAEILNHACQRIDSLVSQGTAIGKAIYLVARKTRNVKHSMGSFRRHYTAWRKNPGPQVFDLKYTPGKSRIADDLREGLILQALSNPMPLHLFFKNLGGAKSLHFSERTLRRLFPDQIFKQISNAWRVGKRYDQVKIVLQNEARARVRKQKKGGWRDEKTELLQRQGLGNLGGTPGRKKHVNCKTAGKGQKANRGCCGKAGCKRRRVSQGSGSVADCKSTDNKQSRVEHHYRKFKS
ncbi:MAG: hypothetical protein A2283_22960 [Lentisphaerae bacterium RIFOXYA12_FULL_48_11]|nr:MAG: hypothetical protein A2283_22960 [Lentisphaerae bacterium RIFOXYA12_FULL_48_11]